MLNIDPQTVCFIAIKAHAFDAKVEVGEPDLGSNPSDENMREVLEDRADDATEDELQALIDGLNVDQQVDLVALTWLGRGDFTAGEMEEARKAARDAHNEHTARYLLGIPLLGDYLEEGLSALNYSCEEYEMGRL